MRAGGGEGRWSVDTAPVLERELAARAGLGWWGKNTCLINRGAGSYFFLAEIVTTLDLIFDTPEVDHCGLLHPSASRPAPPAPSPSPTSSTRGAASRT